MAKSDLHSATMQSNEDVECFLVTKHSWKGRYKRVLAFGDLGVRTLNPASLDVTNQWAYKDVMGVSAASGGPSAAGEFTLHVRKPNGKSDAMRFSADCPADVLTAALRSRHLFGQVPNDKLTVNGFKLHWSDSRVPVSLRVAPYALQQLDQKQRVIAEYFFKDIRELTTISDVPGGLCVSYGAERRLHLFALSNPPELMRACDSASTEYLGVGVRCGKEHSGLTLNECQRCRLGNCAKSDAQLTSLAEYSVYKKSVRHEAPVRRLLCLSESCVLERDPVSYAAVCARPMSAVHCVLRHPADPQRFCIEYANGDLRSYMSTERDELLACLLDGVRAAGNADCFVRASVKSDRCLALGPRNRRLDEEAEGHIARGLVAPPPGCTHAAMIGRFNANVPYSGLLYSATSEGMFSENKERLIVNCLQSVLTESNQATPQEIEAQLHCLRRLFASKAGFHAFTAVPGLREKLGAKVVASLRRDDAAIDHAAVDCLCALMQPMHDKYELRQEQANKNSLLASQSFLEHLLDLVETHATRGTGALVIAALLDFLTYALCAPYSETTAGDRFDTLLNMVAQRGRVFYRLFQSGSTTIVRGAGLVMRALVEEADGQTAERMQALALADGALLAHLRTALFADVKGQVRALTQRQLSRHLVALWTVGNEPAVSMLRRCLPAGLLHYLESKEAAPVSEEDLLLIRNNLNMAQLESGKSGALTAQIEDVHRALDKHMDALLQHWRLRKELNIFKREERRDQRPVVLRRRRERVRADALNWKLFYYQHGREHARASLVWNHKTREELKEAIDAQLRLLYMDKELAKGSSSGAPVAWNHMEFSVSYPSLSNEVRVGGYFLRHLLEEAAVADGMKAQENGEVADHEEPMLIHKPFDFFFEVYHAFLLSATSDMRCMCLAAMSAVYSRHWHVIGPFTDIAHFVRMLKKAERAVERDALVTLLNRLLLHRENVARFLDADGVGALVALAPLAHLHAAKGGAPLAPGQSMAIAPDPENADRHQGVTEWYYSDKDGSRQGPHTFKQLSSLYADGDVTDSTKVWAAGMEAWRPLAAVAQLRWTLVHPEPGSYNFGQLTKLILDTFIMVCEFFPSRDDDGCVVRPMARIRQQLSSPGALAQIVQLFLTFDPPVVERTAQLIYLLMQDNPLVPRLYLTGCFYFALMYAGSNVLPIARLLHYTHASQAAKTLESNDDIVTRSVLAPLLPEAAVYYLENYGPDKYGEVFLGNHNNPEVIWNAEMRRHLITRLAAHVADFSIRLGCNVRAVYQYCPISKIQYAQLEGELFCNMYYLRHLCDTAQFPDWPIREPVAFVRACLCAWKEEIERKEPKMTVKDAIQVLGIKDLQEAESESSVRRAYFKMAQQYHPDKNPEGREMFEKINAAYELLVTTAAQATSGGTVVSGPDPRRIKLCLKAQSIVYQRHADALSQYKYAGYTPLVCTIANETGDQTLFSKSAPLLAAATELCHWTLAASALNAEQLRRENGLEATLSAFERCSSILSPSTKPTSLECLVCLHACRCFAVACKFDLCRERMAGLGQLFQCVCTVLKRCADLPELCSTAAVCVRAMGVDTLLQTQLFQSGILWHLIPNLFQYDYTLCESGVTDTGLAEQAAGNELAKQSLYALAALAGHDDGAPEHDGVSNALRALLTPYVLGRTRDAVQRADEGVHELLKILNGNHETPYLIWDGATRAELLEFVDRHKKSREPQSELFGAEFRYSIYEKELIVGDIFVRVYNEQPNFTLELPKKFAADLLEFVSAKWEQLSRMWSPRAASKIEVAELNGHCANGPSKSEPSGEDASEHARMSLIALANVIRNNPGVELLCIGRFSLLFAFVRPCADEPLQCAALECASLASRSTECVADIAATPHCVMWLFLLMRQRKQMATNILNLLFTLSSDGKVVKDALDAAGLLYLLEVFCAHDTAATGVQNVPRVGAAELLGKLQTDKLTGPRWTRALLLYLPLIFAEAMRDSPKTAVSMFDAPAENPELIWDERRRDAVRAAVNRALELTHMAQLNDKDYVWKMPSTDQSHRPAYALPDDTAGANLVVGGVYVRVFINQPSWTVRNPRHFLTELMERTLRQAKADSEQSADGGEVLETLATALALLLVQQPPLCDQVAAMGYIPQLCACLLSSTSSRATRACLLTLHPLATASKQCVEALARPGCDFCRAVMAGLERRPDLAHAAGATLRAAFQSGSDALVRQALDAGLPACLLRLLGAPMQGVENPAAAKAELVDALKAMAQCPGAAGLQVQQLLDESRVWKEFRDQKHDLFLARAPELPSIAGPVSSAAGYLTQGTALNTPPIEPPSL